MIVSTLQDNLENGLKTIKALSGNTPVQLCTDNGRLRITTMNEIYSISVYVGASVQEDGHSPLLTGFYDVARKLSPDRVDLEAFHPTSKVAHELRFACGAFKGTWEGVPQDSSMTDHKDFVDEDDFFEFSNVDLIRNILTAIDKIPNVTHGLLTEKGIYIHNGVDTIAHFTLVCDEHKSTPEIYSIPLLPSDFNLWKTMLAPKYCDGLFILASKDTVRFTANGDIVVDRHQTETDRTSYYDLLNETNTPLVTATVDVNDMIRMGDRLSIYKPTHIIWEVVSSEGMSGIIQGKVNTKKGQGEGIVDAEITGESHTFQTSVSQWYTIFNVGRICSGTSQIQLSVVQDATGTCIKVQSIKPNRLGVSYTPMEMLIVL